MITHTRGLAVRMELRLRLGLGLGNLKPPSDIENEL